MGAAGRVLPDPIPISSPLLSSKELLLSDMVEIVLCAGGAPEGLSPGAVCFWAVVCSP